MTALTTSCTPRVAATLGERSLFTIARRLERTALRHMHRRAARLDREAVIQAVYERQRDAHAAGALRLFGR